MHISKTHLRYNFRIFILECGKGIYEHLHTEQHIIVNYHSQQVCHNYKSVKNRQHINIHTVYTYIHTETVLDCLKISHLSPRVSHREHVQRNAGIQLHKPSLSRWQSKLLQDHNSWLATGQIEKESECSLAIVCTM